MRRLAPLLLVTALICSACAPGIRIQRLAPAPVNLGSLRHLEVLAIEGRPAESEQALALFAEQVAAGGWFSLLDRRAAGVRIQPGGSGMRFIPESEGPAPSSAGLFLTIHAWDLDHELVLRSDIHQHEGQEVRSVSLQHLQRADVRLQATLVGPDGQVLLETSSGQTLYSEPTASLSHHEYRHRNDESVIVLQPVSGQALLQEAGRQALAAILSPITPRWVRDKILLCNDDEAQEPFIDLAADGQLDAAEAGLRQYLQQQPQNACALFNLGAVLDALGRYQEALDYYGQATALRNEADWHKAAAAARRRLAEAQSLE